MSYRSFFTATLAACALLSGGTASAITLNVSNDDENAYSLLDSLGQSLNGGKAIIGAFNSNSWSYDMEHSQWMFEGNSYSQDQLTYSQLVDMQNSFTSTLGSITPGEQDGTVTDGAFNLTGEYVTSPDVSNSLVYLMVTGKTGELAVFVFRSGANDSLLTYNDLDLSAIDPLELWIATKNHVSDTNYYMNCILGNEDMANHTIQLLVPEPATATLGLLGLAGLMIRRRRR